MLRRLFIIIAIILGISIFHPERHAKYYPYIPKSDTLNELVEKSHDKYSNLTPCVYSQVLSNSIEVSINKIYQKHNFKTPRKGGEYSPSTCQALYKSAIIIPYRNREEQLSLFLNYMHRFLQNQNIHYRIFVVDQRNDNPFNRGLNLNIGAAEAINAGYPCLILHDVDLIPLVTGNIYACSKIPRHMSSAIDTFRYQIPYVELFGGAVAIKSNVFTVVNGFSNKYDGWGGEDDDLYRRLASRNISTCRFAPELSRYTMLKHKKQVPSANRHNLLSEALKRLKTDGLNSLSIQYKIIEKELYTHIIVN